MTIVKVIDNIAKMALEYVKSNKGADFLVVDSVTKFPRYSSPKGYLGHHVRSLITTQTNNDTFVTKSTSN